MAEIVLKNLTKDYRSNEAYKTLRTNIEFSGSDKKVIVFTSCTPNEGKSTVTMGLAASLAEGGKRVLFVDADLRKSVLMGRHRVTGEVKGLTHFLSGQADVKEVILRTQEPNLFVTFAGPVPPNPAELLGSRRFEAFLDGARQAYDHRCAAARKRHRCSDHSKILGCIRDGHLSEDDQLQVRQSGKRPAGEGRLPDPRRGIE